MAAMPTALHPAVLLKLARTRPHEARRALDAAGEQTWERELAAALDAPEPARAGAVNESLTELDHLTRRWARVPRVCASVASSTGFLLASLALRNGLASGASPEETVLAAIDVAAVGVAGAVICVAAQQRARQLAKSRHEDADALVERLEKKPAEN